MNQNQHKRSAFSGKIGIDLSAAGASVGLGNIWRFPYLAAKYGGGIFLLIYIILAFTFGYTMIVAETALGRMTRKSPGGAFAAVRKGGRSFGGWIYAIIPILIVPYYSVIGGWVIRYLSEYISGHGSELSQDGYFSNFISSGLSAEVCFLIFTAFTLAIFFAGVRNGVERVSKVMMPILAVLSVIIAGYSVTRPGALEGVKYFLVPNLSNFSWMTVVTAMGQMFYSLSIAMGILVTFGYYKKQDVSIEASTENIEVEARWLKAHLQSVRAHVDELSQKDYSHYDAKAPDFVMMYIPTEAAYQTAIKADTNLWEYAYNKKVVLMSPTNLISALRLSLDLWKRENQVKNVQDIIKRGTLLYEKIAGFTDTFLRIGDNLSGLQRDYDKAYNQLSDGNGSVVRQAELLRNMSLTPKKRISARLLPEDT